MSEAAKILRLRTSDGTVFEVATNVAKKMGFTHNWLQSERPDCLSSEEDDSEIMPLERVRSEIFQLVLNWCHTIDTLDRSAPLEQAERRNKERSILQSMLNECNADDSTVFELIIAADYLNVESLLQAGTQHVADMINHCDSVEAIRERFHIMSEPNETEE